MAVSVRQTSVLLVSLMAAAALLVFSATAEGEQTERTSPQVYEACKGGKEIPAADLPNRVDLERCPAEEKVIVDNGIGTVMPDPGEGVYVHAMTVAGGQELTVTRYRDGTVELDQVGDESDEAQTDPEMVAMASGPSQCDDSEYTPRRVRVNWTLGWYYNKRTTPSELSRKAAVRAIRKGGANITGVHDACGVRDRVPHGLSYKGHTAARAGLDAGGKCTTDDGKNVVSFGWLPDGALGVTCTHFNPKPNERYDAVRESDIKLNSRHFNWTTHPGNRSCKGRYDVESTVTHERGHTFGLGEVSESSHGNLTMSERSNGPCQSSERSLGRGDARGLNSKYR